MKDAVRMRIEEDELSDEEYEQVLSIFDRIAREKAPDVISPSFQHWSLECFVQEYDGG